MNSNGETQHYLPAHERRFGAFLTAAGVLTSAALGAGAIVGYRLVESRQEQTAKGIALFPEKSDIVVPTEETEGIQTLYICTIQNTDGTVSTVEININGPESPVDIARILAGQTGSVAGILLNGINMYNEQYGTDLALLVGNDVEVLDLTGGLGASAPSPTTSWGLKYSILEGFFHEAEVATATSTVLAP